MLEEYIYCGKNRLRCGYTTGSCAVAAAKASAEMLLTGEIPDGVRLITPKGIWLELEILNTEIHDGYAVCAVKKDSGDDPDITNGILVYAKAEKIPFGIEIAGGEGVGRVTKASLDQPVGTAAINSIPRKMISGAVSEICRKIQLLRRDKNYCFCSGRCGNCQKNLQSANGYRGRYLYDRNNGNC